ncbi:MAG: 2Fe-2S iron-sulfur cluster binding domain-containing protein [Rhodospirillaceae bacterium]|nr:2Fe-2S iron-sulfur cluster binding domain-containing protein [Rhodospirillaceae bacterium]MBL6940546.1 2Fe-2S iron-sulfur cluster binding domain-containing protein [Rhodospirillales bacterium]
MSDREVFKITIKPYGASYHCYPGESLLTASRNSGLTLANNCQKGECGTCKVKIRKGQIKLAPFMLSALSMQEIDADYTLACRSTPLTDVEILVEMSGWPDARFYPRKDKQD